MQFKSGMLGACVVVIALLATVLLGFSLNISEGSESVLKYNSITNVTGQFEGQNVPDYIAYNAPKNYTGYEVGTFTYTSASTANQYSVIKVPGVNDDLGTFEVNTPAYSAGAVSLPISGSSPGSHTVFIGANSGLWLIGGYQLTLNQFITNAGINISNYDVLKIDLTGGHSPIAWPGYDYYFSENIVTVGSVPIGNIGVPPYDSAFNRYDPYYSGVLKLDYMSGSPNNWTNGIIWWTDGLYIPYTTNPDNFASYIMVYPDGTANYYRSGTDIISVDNSTITVTDELVLSSDVGHLYLNWPSRVGYIANTPTSGYPAGGYPTTDQMKEYRAFLNNRVILNDISVSGIIGTVYDYMRISDGIALNSPSVWSNNKLNGSIDWVVKFDVGDSLYITPEWNNTTHGALSMTFDGSGLAASVAGQSYNGGGWNTWHISIDGLNGKVTLTPVTAFNDFQNYTLSQSSKVIDVPAYANGGITAVRLASIGAPRFSVTSTLVNYDISKTSVLNGTMNPRDYFPASDYGQLKITFDSFAVIDDSITINGQTFPVSDNRVSVNGVSMPLNGLSVVYNTDNSISVENGKDSVSLGEAVNNAITFNGIWYFTARALGGYYSEVPVLDWDVGSWATTFSQTIVIYEALLILGGIVARHYFKLKALDWVVIIIAMIGGAVLV